MNAVVFKHVPISDLPEEWRTKLAQGGGALVTVRIEQEPPAPVVDEYQSNNPMFGMWRDREDMADVAAYVRKLRAGRFNDDGTRRDG